MSAARVKAARRLAERERAQAAWEREMERERRKRDATTADDGGAGDGTAATAAADADAPVTHIDADGDDAGVVEHPPAAEITPGTRVVPWKRVKQLLGDYETLRQQLKKKERELDYIYNTLNVTVDADVMAAEIEREDESQKTLVRRVAEKVWSAFWTLLFLWYIFSHFAGIDRAWLKNSLGVFVGTIDVLVMLAIFWPSPAPGRRAHWFVRMLTSRYSLVFLVSIATLAHFQLGLKEGGACACLCPSGKVITRFARFMKATMNQSALGQLVSLVQPIAEFVWLHVAFVLELIGFRGL